MMNRLSKMEMVSNISGTIPASIFRNWCDEYQNLPYIHAEKEMLSIKLDNN
jgi:hypothetical protein